MLSFSWEFQVVNLKVIWDFILKEGYIKGTYTITLFYSPVNSGSSDYKGKLDLFRLCYRNGLSTPLLLKKGPRCLPVC